MGDVFHTLPAINDAWKHQPDIEIHWVVEEGFKDIPTWHPAVKKVIPMAWRRWRKNLGDANARSEMTAFYRALKTETYDKVIDAQGLIKSAVITRMANGPRYGLDKQSAREGLAALAYQHPIAIAKGTHAIQRVRELFAQVLGYQVPNDLEYGVDKTRWQRPDVEGDYWIFLHGTTWVTKLWPEAYWCQLAKQVTQKGIKVFLPWGNQEEKERAERIAASAEAVQVLPKMGLNDLNAWLAHASSVVGVDTGLSHVVASLNIPAVAIYGATDSVLTGVSGPKVTVLTSQYECAPCMSKQCLKKEEGEIQPPCYREISPERVDTELSQIMAK